MRFLCRLEAGRALARRLEHLRSVSNSLILLALPRGGIPVAYEVARVLGIPFEVILTRRLEASGDPVPTFGAISEGGQIVVDEQAECLRALHPDTVGEIVQAATQRLLIDVVIYRGERPLPLVDGRCVVLVDDGITTGSSMRAAARALRKAGARRIVAAAPVVGPGAIEQVRADVDELVYLQAPAEFIGVGYWYTRRGLTEDQAVSLLVRARGELGEAVSPHGWLAAAGAR